jgi:hypothetical protein
VARYMMQSRHESRTSRGFEQRITEKLACTTNGDTFLSELLDIVVFSRLVGNSGDVHEGISILAITGMRSVVCNSWVLAHISCVHYRITPLKFSETVL